MHSHVQVDRFKASGTSTIAFNDYALVVMSGSRTTLKIATYILPKSKIHDSKLSVNDVPSCPHSQKLKMGGKIKPLSEDLHG